MNSKNNKGFTLVELLVVIGILGILSAALFPAITGAMLRANMASVAARGKDIYVAIIGANTEREPLGLGNVWPKTEKTTDDTEDINGVGYSSSSDYFEKLYDGKNAGTDKHSPFVTGFDYSKLAGAGVPASSTAGGELKSDNNMWSIAANIRDEMEDIIPILITRNVDCSTLYANLTTVPPSTEKITFKTMSPFSNKGFVMVRKGGGTFSNQAKYSTIRVIYNSQTFKTTVEGDSGGATKLDLTYLSPDKAEKPK